MAGVLGFAAGVRGLGLGFAVLGLGFVLLGLGFALSGLGFAILRRNLEAQTTRVSICVWGSRFGAETSKPRPIVSGVRVFAPKPRSLARHNSRTPQDFDWNRVETAWGSSKKLIWS